VLFAAGPGAALSQVDVQVQLRVDEEWCERRLWVGGIGLQGEGTGTTHGAVRDSLAHQVSSFLRDQAEEGTS
jgi:hypothetical protein